MNLQTSKSIKKLTQNTGQANQASLELEVKKSNLPHTNSRSGQRVLQKILLPVRAVKSAENSQRTGWEYLIQKKQIPKSSKAEKTEEIQKMSDKS